MPFTPLHMGPALLLKPVLNRRFSLIAFGVAQILIDIEPGIGMWRDNDVLHGPSHTLVGALLIALVAACASRWFAAPLLRRWNQELQHYRLLHLQEADSISWPVATGSAFFGTFSHLLLDGLMHSDMAPLAPLHDGNPLLFAIPVMHVYGWCFALGITGIIAWLVRAIMKRPTTGDRGKPAA